MSKIKLELNRKSISEKTDLAKKIVTKMTANTSFITPNPALTAVTLAVNSLTTAYADMEAVQKTLQNKNSILGQAETTLDGLLTQLGAYVENVSNGDEAKILSAGMDVKKDRTSNGVPDKVSSVDATFGEDSGEIDLSWDRVQGAKSYILETGLNNNGSTEWKHSGVSVRSKKVVNSLQTGSSYQIRIAAINAAGQGPWSDPVVKVAP